MWSLRPDGGVRWSVPVGRDLSGLATGADGAVYVVEARGIARPDGLLVPGTVRAIGPDGGQRWAYRGRIAGRDPVVGGDGTIYVGGSPLVALRRDGTRAWAFPPASRAIVPDAIGADGTLYAEGGGGAMFALAGSSAPPAGRGPLAHPPARPDRRAAPAAGALSHARAGLALPGPRGRLPAGDTPRRDPELHAEARRPGVRHGPFCAAGGGGPSRVAGRAPARRGRRSGTRSTTARWRRAATR